MSPVRVIGWSLALILGSGAVVAVVVASAFLYGLVEMVLK